MADSIIESSHPATPEGDGQLMLHWPNATPGMAWGGLDAAGAPYAACWEIWGYLRFVVPEHAAGPLVDPPADLDAEWLAGFMSDEVEVVPAAEHFAIVKLVMHGATERRAKPELDPLHPLAVVVKARLMQHAIAAVTGEWPD